MTFFCWPAKFKFNQSAENRSIFPSFFRTQLSRPLEFRSTPSRLFSLRLIFHRSKLESLRDVSVTRIGDTLSYGFFAGCNRQQNRYWLVHWDYYETSEMFCRNRKLSLPSEHILSRHKIVGTRDHSFRQKKNESCRPRSSGNL